jgi:hypothetical protein
MVGVENKPLKVVVGVFYQGVQLFQDVSRRQRLKVFCLLLRPYLRPRRHLQCDSIRTSGLTTKALPSSKKIFRILWPYISHVPAVGLHRLVDAFLQ